MKQSHRNLLLWVLLILIFLGIYQMFRAPDTSNQVSFSEFLKQVKAGNVTKVTVRGKVYTFFKHGADGEKDKQFRTVGLTGEKINAMLMAKGVQVTYKRPEQNSFWQQIIISWLPIIFLIGIFVLFMRQLQSGGGKAMQFGRSRAKLLNDHQNKKTFKDVAGVEEAKEELEEIVTFLREPKKFTKLGGRIPKGVLLVGSPGTGKTLLARAVAGEAGVPFFSISGSDFVEMFVGVGASRVRDLFEQGKRNAPCIIFVDEIDAVGRHRGAGLGGGHDEREQTLNQLLVEMDGFESNEGVIMVAATNRPDVLDPALLRPGRFDRQVVVPLPDVLGREEILRVHVERTPLDDDVQLDVISRGTPGFSGADLENLVNEAALTAARDDSDRVYMEHFERAKDKVMMGSERRSMMLSDEEKRRTAVHEAGHAIVGLMLPFTDPVHKVSIVPRGRALGVTMTLPVEDRKDVFEGYLENTIAFMMGGRAADMQVYGQKTAGASDDIRRATDLARRMVCEWGMSPKLGPVAYGKRDEQVFLGREISQSRNYSETVAVEIDREIQNLVQTNYERAQQILVEHKDILEQTTELLMQDEVISGDSIVELLKAKGVEPINGSRKPMAELEDDDAPSPVESEENDAAEPTAEVVEETPDNNDGDASENEAFWGVDNLFGEDKKGSSSSS